MTRPRIHVDFEARNVANIMLGADVYARHFTCSPTMLAIVAPHVNVAYVEDFLLGVSGYQRSIFPFANPGDLNFRMIKPPCPAIILQAIAEDWVFVAHNARFEQTLWYHICHKLWGWPMPKHWSCTAARARYWGLRASLDGVGSDLEITNQKDENGKQFINDFCKPRKWKGAQKLGIIKDLWYEPQDNPDGWQRGLDYCLRDAYAEMEVDAILPDLPDFEQRIFDLDFKLNMRGIPIDLPSVNHAIRFSDHFTAQSFARFDAITSLRPTQRQAVLDYINQREDIEALGDLRSKTLRRIVASDMPADLQDVIQIRLETSKASVKKLQKMEACTDDDGRARGGHLYGGAHTMRWAHKRIQTGNMTRPDPSKPQDYMFQYLGMPIWEDDGLAADMPVQPAWVTEAAVRFVRPLSYLSTSMRGFIKPEKGKRLISGDYAQIEARKLTWFARCMWLLEAFKAGKDTYTMFAADHMYRNEMGGYENCIEVLPNGKHKVLKKWGLHRQKAKSAQLGCGFQVSGRGFVAYCDNIDLIISEQEGNDIVRAYRGAHIEIADPVTGLWTRMYRAAVLATLNEGQTIGLANTGITFHVHRLDNIRYWLLMTLPSGRHMAYYRPKVREGLRFGRVVEILSFRTEWNGKSYREDTYGGKLTENAVQASARDICAIGALNVEDAGYPVIMLVHDEVVTEVDMDFGSADEMAALMCKLPPWITDLPVEAEAGIMSRYGKG